MTVAHTALFVENLPASTAFFQSALHPLGYRYLGTQGDQICFGIQDAQFALSPVNEDFTHEPAHVSFHALDKIAVRDFYSAAVEAGGTPFGNPSYRGENDEIFNTAVVDPEGNTIEVIYNIESQVDKQTLDAILPVPDENITTRLSEADPHYETARRLPVATDQPRTLPSRTFVGTLIGAAAGAAALYAMSSSRRDSSRRESEFYRACSHRDGRAGRQRAESTPRHYQPMEHEPRRSSLPWNDDRRSRTVRPSDFGPRAARTSVRQRQRSATYDEAPEVRSHTSKESRRDSGISLPSHHSDRSRRSRHGDEHQPRKISKIQELLVWKPRSSRSSKSNTTIRASNYHSRPRDHHSTRSSRRSARKRSPSPIAVSRPAAPSRGSAARIPLPPSAIETGLSNKDREWRRGSETTHQHRQADDIEPVRRSRRRNTLTADPGSLEAARRAASIGHAADEPDYVTFRREGLTRLNRNAEDSAMTERPRRKNKLEGILADDNRTVVPDDSISCVLSRTSSVRRHESRRSEHDYKEDRVDDRGRSERRSRGKSDRDVGGGRWKSEDEDWTKPSRRREPRGRERSLISLPVRLRGDTGGRKWAY